MKSFDIAMIGILLIGCAPFYFVGGTLISRACWYTIQYSDGGKICQEWDMYRVFLGAVMIALAILCDVLAVVRIKEIITSRRMVKNTHD